MNGEQLTMSMFATKEDLYKAKADYYEKLYKRVSGQLEFCLDMIPNLDEVLEQYDERTKNDNS